MGIKTEIQNGWFDTLHERCKNALAVFKDSENINVCL